MTLFLFALVIVALGAYSLGHSRGVRLERARLPKARSTRVTHAPCAVQMIAEHDVKAGDPVWVRVGDHAAEVGR